MDTLPGRRGGQTIKPSTRDTSGAVGKPEAAWGSKGFWVEEDFTDRAEGGGQRGARWGPGGRQAGRAKMGPLSRHRGHCIREKDDEWSNREGKENRKGGSGEKRGQCGEPNVEPHSAEDSWDSAPSPELPERQSLHHLVQPVLLMGSLRPLESYPGHAPSLRSPQKQRGNRGGGC